MACEGLFYLQNFRLCEWEIFEVVAFGSTFAEIIDGCVFVTACIVDVTLAHLFPLFVRIVYIAHDKYRFWVMFFCFGQ